MPPQQPRPQAYASLPGQMSVQWPVWVRCFPGSVALPATLILILLALLVCLLIFTGAKGLIPSAALVAVIYRLWQRIERAYARVRRQFNGGCVNPARVVAPDMIAVYTDLSNSGGGFWPSIKIVRQPLSRSPGRPPRVGDRLAAVSLYGGSMSSKPYWDDFFPIAANCVTADEADLRRLMANLDAEAGEWDNLDRYLSKVPTQTRPGLYRLQK